jgi:hypothetical protein
MQQQRQREETRHCKRQNKMSYRRRRAAQGEHGDPCQRQQNKASDLDIDHPR